MSIYNSVTSPLNDLKFYSVLYTKYQIKLILSIVDLQEETDAIYLDEHVKQTNFCEKDIDISDEDDIPHASTTPEYVSQIAAESTNLSNCNQFAYTT